MPGPIWRVPSAVLYPQFTAKVIQLLSACEAQGAVFYVTSGLRTFDEQTKLFNQGRTTPGKIVTNARAGESLHNFGIAVDLTHDSDANPANGLQPDWVRENYRILSVEAPKLGLESGFNWKFPDAPHIQWPLPAGVTLPILKAAYLKGGMEAVFKLLA